MALGRALTPDLRYRLVLGLPLTQFYNASLVLGSRPLSRARARPATRAGGRLWPPRATSARGSPTRAIPTSRRCAAAAARHRPGQLGRALSAAAGLLPARQQPAAEESEEDTGGDADADAGAEDAQQTEQEEAPGPAVKVEKPERTAVPRKPALKRMRLNNWAQLKQDVKDARRVAVAFCAPGARATRYP